jgi:hypothetical protein
MRFLSSAASYVDLIILYTYLPFKYNKKAPLCFSIMGALRAQGFMLQHKAARKDRIKSIKERSTKKENRSSLDVYNNIKVIL